MIQGSCLCGAIKFQISNLSGPMEICHCNRCRKTSGSNSLTTIHVRTEDLEFTHGSALIKSYAAPILYSEPPYQSHFCSECGSPTPPANTRERMTEIPAGLLDDDPCIKPDKHIFIEFLPNWDTITDDIPQFDIRDLIRERRDEELPADFELKTHR